MCRENGHQLCCFNQVDHFVHLGTEKVEAHSSCKCGQDVNGSSRANIRKGYSNRGFRMLTEDEVVHWKDLCRADKDARDLQLAEARRKSDSATVAAIEAEAPTRQRRIEQRFAAFLLRQQHVVPMPAMARN